MRTLDHLLEEGGVAADHVVRADQRGVAADIAGADPGSFQDRNVSDAMVLRQVICRRESMSAATHDDRVVLHGRSNVKLLQGCASAPPEVFEATDLEGYPPLGPTDRVIVTFKIPDRDKPWWKLWRLPPTPIAFALRAYRKLQQRHPNGAL